uniref:Ig-like domain-containing protein n=1 Tax=Oryzias melastigma TaxID=30732 RepID=A0A3B3BVY8_ORYME
PSTSLLGQDPGCLFTFFNIFFSPDPPRSPSVHLSRTINGSGQILEGSSVTLTCSSDANPAANYTWFKENKDSPKSEEQMFTISDITAEDGGLYICVAQNKLGQQNSTVQVSVGSGKLRISSAAEFKEDPQDP